MEDAIRKIRYLIGEDDAKSALQLLSSLLHQDKRLDEVILLSARQNRVEKEVREGVVDYINANLTKNQVNKALLEICRKIEDFIPAKHSHLETLYLKKLIRNCEFIPLSLVYETQTSQTVSSRKVKLADIFMPLYLEYQDLDATRKTGKSKVRIFKETQPIRLSPGHIYPRDGVAEISPGYHESEISPRNHVFEIEDAFSRFQAVEAVAATPRLVILGQAGGGKSSLINHLTVQLAKKRLNGTFDDEQTMPGWKSGQNPLPVRIILSEFVDWLSENNLKTGDENIVWNYLKSQLKKYRCKKYYDSLEHELDEIGGVIFFDGLDEVLDDNQRVLVQNAIMQFADSVKKSSILITCREHIYQEKPGGNNESTWRLDAQQFPVAKLTQFEKKDIEAFIDRWYQTTGPSKGWDSERCEREAKHLARTIDKAPHLKELARYPLFLTLIVNIHRPERPLPEGRADLFEHMIRLRLAYSENRAMHEIKAQRSTKSDRVEAPNLAIKTLRDILAKIAFAAHEKQEREEQGSKNAVNISREDMRDLLEDELGNLNKAQDAIEYLLDRAALLRRVDRRTYTFIHHSFQEYLAAVHILKHPDFVDKIRDLVFKDEDLSWWREVFLLVANISGEKTARNIVSLVDALLPEPAEPWVNPQNINRGLLVSQALVDNKWGEIIQNEAHPWAYTRTLKNVQTWLVHGLRPDKKLPLAERIAAGLSLARLADPREEIISLDQMPFCYVPPGAYYRSSPGNSMDDHEKSGPLHSSIDKAYWISRYPVSQAQFRHFVDDRGYQYPGYWEESLRWKDGKYDGIAAPEKVDKTFGLPNHPVVGVSWYEALAFTRWLTEKWKDNILPSGYEVRLPTESEWEKAVLGGLDIPVKPVIVAAKKICPEVSCQMEENPDPQRTYPWGGSEADPNRMNVKESKINATSPLGCFPAGAGPYGSEEMCGNVSEWCFDKEEGGYDGGASFAFRVVRGGSWQHSARFSQTAYRSGNTPHLQKNYLGFRLVIAGP